MTHRQKWANFYTIRKIGLLIWPSLSSVPASNPPYAHFDFQIIDSANGNPVEAEITIRRTTVDGSLIEPEAFYSGLHFSLDAPVDAYFTWILVEAEGYQDWELRLRPKKPGSLTGPIRLVPRDFPPETPSVDAES